MVRNTATGISLKTSGPLVVVLFNVRFSILERSMTVSFYSLATIFPQLAIKPIQCSFATPLMVPYYFLTLYINYIRNVFMPLLPCNFINTHIPGRGSLWHYNRRRSSPCVVSFTTFRHCIVNIRNCPNVIEP